MQAIPAAALMGMPRQYNAVQDMVDRNVDRGLGDKIAFADPDRSLTYGALQSATNQMANALQELQIGRETRIALLMHDNVDYPVAFWGAVRAGVIPVCLNTLLTTAQYDYILSDSRVEALFVAAPLLAVVAPLFDRLEFLRHVIVVGEDGGEYRSFRDLLAGRATAFETAPTCADETAFWLYSSGSTGDPKGVRHIHTSPIYVAENYGRNILSIQPDDVCFAAAKLFFAYGLGAGVAIPMSVGATAILLPDRPSPTAALEVLQRFCPTLCAALLADPRCCPENSSDQLRLGVAVRGGTGAERASGGARGGGGRA